MSIYPNENDVLSLVPQLSTPVQIQPVLPETNQIPAYVYKLVHKPTGQFYIGYRKRNITFGRMPKDDLWKYYFTSSKYVKAILKMDGVDSFDCEILHEIFDTRRAFWIEQEMILEHIGNPLLLNKRCDRQGDTGKPIFVSTPESAKKAAETKKRRGTDISGAKKSSETKRMNNSASSKAAAAKAVATRRSKGILKSAALKAAVTRKANDSYRTGGIKGIATRISNGTLLTGLQAAWDLNVKQWRITSPAGEVYEVTNLSEFCRQHNLCSSVMNAVDKGRSKQHKGWLCECLSTPPAVREEIIRSNTKEKLDRNTMDYTNDMQWIVTNPVGDEIPVKNLRRFSRDNGLDYSCMRDVAKGRQSNHRGWKCECLSKEEEKTTYRWEAIDPNGVVHQLEDFKQFCIDNNLNQSNMRHVAAGRHHYHNGWKCNKIVVEKPVITWEIMNPEGQVYITTDLRQFCEDNGLGFKQMTKISNGNTTKHRGGWKCKRLD